MEDFEELSAEAKKRGIGLMLDMVFNLSLIHICNLIVEAFQRVYYTVNMCEKSVLAAKLGKTGDVACQSSR